MVEDIIKYKTYLLPVKGNRAAYDVLVSRKFKKGALIELPQIRVSTKNSRIYGRKYRILVPLRPSSDESFIIPRRYYRIKRIKDEKRTWKLEFIDISKLKENY